MSKKLFSTLFITAVAAFAAAQDVSTTRFLGMAGSGLALPIGVGSRGSLNPALYGFAGKKVSFDWPGVGYHTKGVSTSELLKDIRSLNSKGLRSSTLVRIARDFGTGTAELGAEADVGLGFDGVHFDVEGQALATTVPNAALIRDATEGIFNDLNDNLDGYGYGYWSADFGYGHALSLGRSAGGDTLMLGARIRLIHTYYAHRFVSGNQILQSQSTTPGFGAEMNGHEMLAKDGVGLDLGLDYCTGRQKNVYLGAVARNLLPPKVGFDGTFADEQGFGIPGEINFNPFKTQFDLGAGYVPTSKWALAADFHDVGNNGNGEELRLGVDYTVNRWLNLQAGYGSRSSFAAGFGVGGVSVAFGPRLPLSLLGTFRF